MYNFGVGATKSIVVSGTTRQVRIIGFNHDDAVDTAAGDKIGITFQFTAVLPPNRRMHASNPTTWSATELRGTLNGATFLNTLPADLRAVIRPAVKLSNNRNQSPATPSNETVWILCDREYRANAMHRINISGGVIPLLTGEVYEFWTTNNATMLAPNISIFTRTQSSDGVIGFDSRWPAEGVMQANNAAHGTVPVFGV